MKYSEKVQAKTHPCKYDVDSKTFQRGAWRHWERFVDHEGRLTRAGSFVAQNDRAFLQRRLRAHSQEFVQC